MAKKLKFKFDPNQPHQLAAIDSVINLLEGLPTYDRPDFILDEIVPNLPPDESIYEDFLLENLQAVQRGNNLPESTNLEVDDGMVLEGTGFESWRSPSFTIEMETGTGKTYAYLRTIHELRKHYGFKKFIIIVPSIAIYEGVKKTSQTTCSHFRSLYGNDVVNFVAYSGTQINYVKNFATSSFTEIMVMTIDSFNKLTNNLYKPSEKVPGERLPYQFIQETRPILILDEPQSIDNSNLAKEALRTLHPLFTLRYSATHRYKPNLVYRLTPVDAYQFNLVKKIQVIGITELESLNTPVFTLNELKRNPIRAVVKTLVQQQGVAEEATITLKQGDNLYDKTHRPEYQHGYRVIEISVADGNEFIKFENERIFRLNENYAPSRPEIFRSQIRETIKQHMRMQQKLRDRDIKILSLFFIDKVANYTSEQGFIRTTFDAEFEKLKAQYPCYQNYTAQQVRNAYFAKKKTKSGIEQSIDTESRNKPERQAEQQAFNLIMKDKERLLSFDEPVSFVFAHSALKEGWDNPNVFQICTLNETISEIKKRQEIGRGLRLCVDQTGQRIFDDAVNTLTVIANESYEDYAESLQSEYIETGEEAPPRPKRPQQGITNRRDDLFYSQYFKTFWQKLCQGTEYKVHIETDRLIQDCVKKLDMIDFPEPQIVLSRGRFVITEYKITLESVSSDKARIKVETRSTDQSQNSSLFEMPYYFDVDTKKKSKEISSKFPHLRGFKVSEIIDHGDNSVVRFSGKSETELTKYKPIVLTSEKGQVHSERTIETIEDTYPVFNLIDRAAKETNLTRSTLHQIFQGMDADQKSVILRNPEGFASKFISTIKAVATEHIVENIEFTLKTNLLNYDSEELFPPENLLAQKELIDAGVRGLYDKVQCDSEVEENFVSNRIQADEDNVILYFKFPPKFRIKLPKIIGNYNPDWGIVRQNRNGQHTLELVRETKGRIDIENLRFEKERYKVKCAQKYFKALGIDYQVVDGTENDWWTNNVNTQISIF
jgi:type III restriction enzyme